MRKAELAEFLYARGKNSPSLQTLSNGKEPIQISLPSSPYLNVLAAGLDFISRHMRHDVCRDDFLAPCDSTRHAKLRPVAVIRVDRCSTSP